MVKAALRVNPRGALLLVPRPWVFHSPDVGLVSRVRQRGQPDTFKIR